MGGGGLVSACRACSEQGAPPLQPSGVSDGRAKVRGLFADAAFVEMGQVQLLHAPNMIGTWPNMAHALIWHTP
eukprot:4449212-Prymnesium_polylepis.1